MTLSVSSQRLARWELIQVSLHHEAERCTVSLYADLQMAREAEALEKFRSLCVREVEEQDRRAVLAAVDLSTVATDKMERQADLVLATRSA